jgi:DNA invertase Pin-like site-specific DNA recombinase
MYEDSNQVDFKSLKYVLYVRKSTDDPKRQIRSIPDQISECKKFALRLGLNIVNIVEETKSAKKPNNRPEFTKMLVDIKNKKYDGIIAWNPDRLARNMKEGGEIIDMVDEDVIKDMKFVTHHFSKDANGKMLLGMSFVLSKQYSDNLSQNVLRGRHRSFEAGNALTPKHGYRRNKEGLYEPDGKNFEIISNAWIMRKEGKSLDNIADYINKSGYVRKTIDGKTKSIITKQVLSPLFKNPFYYGLSIEKGKEIDLREIYDFKSAVSEADYNEIQYKFYKTKDRTFQKKRGTYYPLKGIVKCSYCNSTMYVGPSRSRGGNRYLYYRCSNKGCTRDKKSIRAKIIFDYIYDFLEKGLNFTEKEYNKFYADIEKMHENRLDKFKIELHSRQSSLSNVTKKIRDIAEKLIDIDKTSVVWTVNSEKILKLQEEEENQKNEIKKLQEKISKNEVIRISLDEFLNTSKNASLIVKRGNAVQKDIICRNIFLNIFVGVDEIVSVKLKEPFNTLLKERVVNLNRVIHKYIEPHDIYVMLKEKIAFVREFNNNWQGPLFKASRDLKNKYRNIVL